MKTTQKKFDLTKSASLRVESVRTPSKLQSGADIFIQHKGPKLTLEPLFDRIYVTDPDAGKEEPGMIGGIHTGTSTPIGFAIVDALTVGPGATGIKIGDRLLVDRGSVKSLVHEGNSYFFTFSGGVQGIVR